MGYFLILLGLALLVGFGLKLYSIMNSIIAKAEVRAADEDRATAKLEINQASILGKRIADLDSEPPFAGMVIESSYDRKAGWLAHALNAYGDKRTFELTRLVWEDNLMAYRYYRAKA